MYLVPQPLVLAKLTQVEEMLIARVALVLQVTHSRGGQYKYSGHTLSFPQGITGIASLLPRCLHDVEVVIVLQNEDSMLKHSDQRSFFPVESRLDWKSQACPYLGHLEAIRNHGHVLIHGVATHTYTSNPLYGKSFQ